MPTVKIKRLAKIPVAVTKVYDVVLETHLLLPIEIGSRGVCGYRDTAANRSTVLMERHREICG
jgi:hypothetical protein